MRVPELLSIGVKYDDQARTKLIAYSVPELLPSHEHVLVVEDCLESGRSLEVARDLLAKAGNDVRTASLFITWRTKYIPNYYNEVLPAPPRFPWD